MERRRFIKSLTASASLAVLPVGNALPEINKKLPVKTKISLNAYSFNAPLRSGEMNIDDMLEFAAETGFEGVDLTGYYFPGYPEVPTDEYIYHIKRKAFGLGLEICGSGVKNDFTLPDASARQAEKQLVKNWVQVTAKLGGQTLRIFSGAKVPEGYSRTQTFKWMIADIQECVKYAGQHGVVLAIQNHDDFLKTADEVEEVFRAIDSEYLGLMLDIGCYRGSDPFAEIEQTIRYAVTWQVKEEMHINRQPVKTDLSRLKNIIDKSQYRGYLPIETLGPGDPKQKVSLMYREVKKLFG